MTFSIAGRCERTGMFGVAIATSSICVGSRCPHARAGIGAVATQNITDPHLANLVLDRLAAGDDASKAVQHVVKNRDHIDYRQLTAIDSNGATSHFTGSRILGTHAVQEADNCIAAGNMLSSTDVIDYMTGAFNTDISAHLGERLLTALEAGISAGGEQGPVHSAALKVVDKMPFALIDLRVDWHDTNPTAALRYLWTAYEPQMLDYLNRAKNPTAAPSYGVAGDP
ncbi:MAG: DUF1028 domain-containing protein [Granulosicoccus sp.]